MTTPTHERPLIGGVCVSLADRLGLDVTLVRLAFALLALAHGLGIVLYAVLWLLSPDGVRTEVVTLRLAGLGERFGRHSRSLTPRRRAIALGAMGLGVLALLASLGAFDWLSATRAIALAIIAMGGAALLSPNHGPGRSR